MASRLLLQTYVHPACPKITTGHQANQAPASQPLAELMPTGLDTQHSCSSKYLSWLVEGGLLARPDVAARGHRGLWPIQLLMQAPRHFLV